MVILFCLVANIIFFPFPSEAQDKNIPKLVIGFPTMSSDEVLFFKHLVIEICSKLEIELESADKMDLLVSFIKTAGINLLFPALKKFTDQGGELRVITTTYLGASDPAAIKKLNGLKNTQIKINYDTKHSRLHAKAYFVHRKSGLSCAYIGSANLSHAAMTSGLEWTVKLPLKFSPKAPWNRIEPSFATSISKGSPPFSAHSRHREVISFSN